MSVDDCQYFDSASREQLMLVRAKHASLSRTSDQKAEEVV